MTESGASPIEVPVSLHDPSLYLDRELSLIAFQARVLEEAQDFDGPLLEQVKFLSILFSNLDEFYMVRVAALKQKLATSNPEGIPEQLDKIGEAVRRIVKDGYQTWAQLRPLLGANGIDLRDYSELNERERKVADQYFRASVYPILTPLAFDPGRPFPHISSLSINLAVALRDAKGVERFARVKIPVTLPQLVTVTDPEAPAGAKPAYVWLEQLVEANLHELFPGIEIMEAYPFRVTRDADVAIQELESDDLLETVEEAIWQRQFRQVVRLEFNESMPPHIFGTLGENLGVTSKDFYQVDGPLDLSRLRQLFSLDRPDLKDVPFVPYTPPDLHLGADEDMFAVIRREDQLLHHPYESFQPVVEFLRRAAVDPDVMAIKMMLYRVGRNSPIVESLMTANENGKQVAVMVELKARFDEESNIEWARAMEAEGVHVVYGLLGLKVHAKVALVVRREGDSIRRYVHLGTGNYNPSTAKLYTDLSLFTADEQIGADVTDLFNYVTGYSAKTDYRKLLVAPVGIRHHVEALIDREIQHAQQGREGRILFKMNALEDPGMIRQLYEASQAGVKIDLIVRGICCLRPGVPGISDNIRVRSVVGRFLEHSRIYYFGNDGHPEIYAGSADLMGRNLNHRVEVLFPITNKKLISRLGDGILQTYLDDNRNSRFMQPDGSYVWDKSGDPPVDSQAHFLISARLI
jgi:polyphosphate kinase